MTEREAWLEIAARFEEGLPDRGICADIMTLYYLGSIDKALCKAMLRKVETYAGRNAYLLPILDFDITHTPDCDQLRACICRDFAKECK